jgi:uncharacterized damage-inducible protein DinB
MAFPARMSDMWLPQDEDPRMQAGPTRGEKETVLGYLEHYRATLELKCGGLSPGQLATASVPPSRMSLLGMVRHLTRVEHHWARRVLDGDTSLERLFQSEDAGFALPEVADAAYVEQAWVHWRSEVEHARSVADAMAMDALVEVHGERIEVRDVLVHLVEEYARHLGHVDLLRECLDGRVGQ